MELNLFECTGTANEENAIIIFFKYKHQFKETKTLGIYWGIKLYPLSVVGIRTACIRSRCGW
jgi:hypothetical protein